MPAPMEDEVQAELERIKGGDPQAQLTKAEVDSAQRSLCRLEGVEASQEMINLHVALRRAGGEKSRINAAQLLGWKQRLCQSTAVKCTYWLVPKTNVPVLGDLAQYVVDPSTVVDVPAGLNLTENYLMGDAAPRASLGLGVRSIQVSMAIQRTKGVVPRQESLQLPGPSPRAPVSDSQAAPSATSPQNPRAPQTPRVLLPRASDELPEQQAAEEIAKNCKNAFMNARYFSSDPLNSSTVVFWMERYKEHILQRFKQFEGEPAEFVKGLEEHSRLLIMYVVKTVLNPPKEIPFRDIHPFANVLEELLQIPGLVPATGKAICTIAKRDVAERSPICLGLTLQQQAVFFKSAMYESFLSHRATTRLQQAVADVDAPEAQRLIDVTSIAADGHLTEQQMQSVDFAKTMFGAASADVKLEFLFGKEERFALLSQWAPTDNRLRMLPFLQKQSVWSDADPEKFLADALTVCSSKGCLALVQHVVMKSLLSLHSKLVAMVAGHEGLEILASQILLDLAHLKINMPRCELQVPYKSLEKDFVEQLPKMSAAVGHKDLARGGPGVLFLQRFLKAEETKPKAETAKEEKPQKDGKKEEAEKPAQKASLHGFPVDSIVITVASKNKDKYHDQKAKVLAELTSHVKVQLLSGPAIAETRKYDPKCLKLADDGVTQPDNEDDKKRKAEADDLLTPASKRAAALFADTDLQGL